MLLAIERPVVVFDTSAINALHEDVDRDAKLRILRCAYYPRLVFSVLDELVATPDSYKNKQFYDMSLSLQSAGDCMLPFNYLLIAHISAYCSGTPYDWKAVNCNGNDMKKAIIDNRHGMTEILTEEQRTSNKSTEDQYKAALKSFRKLLQGAQDPQGTYQTAEDFLKSTLEANGRFWRLAASLMNKALEIINEERESEVVQKELSPLSHELAHKKFAPSDAVEFAEICPPFKTLIYGISQSEYSRVHDPSLNSKQREKSAGRADTYMSTYLPYCRFFVTNDAGQFQCLAPTALRSDVQSDVLMYDDFWKKLPY